MLNNIPVILAADDNYTLYTGVCIKSILENSDKNYNYDFYIIGEGLNTNNEEQLSLLLSPYSNASLHILNLSDLLDKYDETLFYAGASGQYNISTYYRFFLADIFKNFDKVLYIDSDTIVLGDISRLYNTDISNYYIAACRDIYMKCWRKLEKNMETYLQEKLNLNSTHDYFQAGILLVNINAFKKYKIKQQLFDKLKDVKFPKVVDQDILNSVCQDKVFYIDSRWNYDCNLENMVKAHPDILRKSLNNSEMSEYLAAHNSPFIVHFAGSKKPWKIPTLKFGYCWWKYARMTPFYEEILFTNILSAVPKPSVSVAPAGNLGDVLKYIETKRKYHKYKFLSKITIGKMHKRYKAKRKEAKAKLKELKILIKGQ